MKFLRGAQDFSLLEWKKNEDIRRKINVVSLHQKTEDHKRRWCEHFNRMADIRLPVADMGDNPTGKGHVGRPRKIWVSEQVFNVIYLTFQKCKTLCYSYF